MSRITIREDYSAIRPFQIGDIVQSLIDGSLKFVVATAPSQTEFFGIAMGEGSNTERTQYLTKDFILFQGVIRVAP